MDKVRLVSGFSLSIKERLLIVLLSRGCARFNKLREWIVFKD